MTLSTPHRAHALRVLRTLREEGFEAYFVGGCVRDELLDVVPKDYDVATNALPERVLELFPDALPVGKSFGVVLVPDNATEGVSTEVATFRADGSYSDGRRPDSVVFGSQEADAERRDFTINGLYYDPVLDEVIDKVGGLEDLNARIVRAIGDPELRFEEDRLRMLRAIRFACQLHFDIHGDTWEAIQKHADKILQVSWERIAMEVNRMLMGPSRDRAMRFLWEIHLLDSILPELAHAPNEALSNTLSMLSLAGGQGVPLRLSWSILLHSHAEKFGSVDGCIEVLRRFRQPNELQNEVSWILGNFGRARDLESASASKVKRLLREEWAGDLLRLEMLKAMAANADTGVVKNLIHKRSRWLSDSENELYPKLPINGKDVIEAGIPAGPKIQRVLDALEDAFLEGQRFSREDALNFVRSFSEA